MQGSLEEDLTALNQAGMNSLEAGSPLTAFDHLSKAELLLKQSKVPSTDRLWGITLNNLGCYYQHIGKVSMALHYHERALQMSPVDFNDHLNVAGIYMNLLNLHMKSGNSSKATWAGKQAISHLKPYSRTSPVAWIKHCHVQNLLNSVLPAPDKDSKKVFMRYGHSPEPLPHPRKLRTCRSIHYKTPRLKATEIPSAMAKLASLESTLRKSRRTPAFILDKLRVLRQRSLCKSLKSQLSQW